MRRSATKRKGFTLIELLVVIAIIAILAAVLFPVFARVRESARCATCASNLGQVGRGLKLYRQDYDTYPVHNWGDIEPGHPLWSWCDIMMGYCPDSGVFVCPSDDDPDGDILTKKWEWRQDNFHYSYAINLTATGRSYWGPFGWQAPVDTELPIDWSRFILIAEAHWCWFLNADEEASLNPDAYATNHLEWRHPRPSPRLAMNGAMNVLMGDMHVVHLTKGTTTQIEKRGFRFKM